MRALQYTAFTGPLELVDVAEPVPGPRDAVVAVEATGLCRSDVSAWSGHDDDVLALGVSPEHPHVAGHELVGRVVAVGAEVDGAWVGRRATTPFVCACGRCPECLVGDGQVCREQSQPGFTHHGSWADRVLVHDAGVNLVEVPDGVDAGAAALLGCRFATAHRALVQVARLRAGEPVLVLGCGGVGLSAVMVAVALGADVVVADVDPAALDRARELGAADAVLTRGLAPQEVADAVRSLRPDLAGGVAVSLDAAGRAETLAAGVLSLARRGRHVQVGLLAADPVSPPVPVGRVTTHELSLLGSHGLDARSYPALLELVTSGALRPQDLVARWVPLADAAAVEALVRAMAAGTAPVGVTMLRP